MNLCERGLEMGIKKFNGLSVYLVSFILAAFLRIFLENFIID